MAASGRDRLFLDTAYVLALFNRRDDLHVAARALMPRVRRAAEVWTTEAILIEIGNALARSHRGKAAQFIESCYATPNIHVEAVDSALLRRALTLYASRSDKTSVSPTVSRSW